MQFEFQPSAFKIINTLTMNDIPFGLKPPGFVLSERVWKI